MNHEIPVYFSNSTFLHKPQVEVHRGDEVMHPDQVGRAESILSALRAHGFDCISVSGQPHGDLLSAVHAPEYLAFLSEASHAIARRPSLDPQIDGGVAAIYPSTFAFTDNRRPRQLEGTIGRYAIDTYTPVMASTYVAARGSVLTAVRGAEHIIAEGGVVYALTRPPGHHAMRDRMGGYCYLNNAAIAAQYFIGHGVLRVSIFDPDLHHGNGIQEYAWHRPDVQYISIHGDPSYCYPFYTGYADEEGEGLGVGTVINYPLRKGTGERTYHRVVRQAVSKIQEFGPDVLIVTAGFDTHKDDPLGTFRLSTGYYRTLAHELDKLDLPTLVVQEGGYNVRSLGFNVVSFLSGFSMK